MQAAKRILSLTLVLVLVLALAACGAQSSTATTAAPETHRSPRDHRGRH